jgi:hypothetical protein
MTSPADLERITHKLDQAYAITAFSGGTALLSGVRLLLEQLRSDDMPTPATRAQWIQITETMLRVGGGAATSDDIRSLGLEIHRLREAIVHYLARIAY